MATKWLEKFIDNLAKLLDKPPYLLFVFMAGVFVIISLATKNYFEQIWIFFLYSVFGMMFRYIERDFLSTLRKKKLIIISIYHAVNICLLFALLYYLKLL